MIQFSVGGELLDLSSKISLQFTKKNILFAFDNIECERSTSFDIPATPKNDRIFGFSRNVATQGNGMRHRFGAQMRDGFTVKDGYLYIDSYSGGKYKAIFVTGELLGLLAIRELGNVNELLADEDEYEAAGVKNFCYLGGTPYDGNTDTPDYGIANIKHHSNTGRIVPSVSLNHIADWLYASRSLQLPQLTTRVILGSIKEPADVDGNFVGEKTGNQYVRLIDQAREVYIMNAVEIDKKNGAYFDELFVMNGRTTYYVDEDGVKWYGRIVSDINPRSTCTMFFGNIPDDCFLVTNPENPDALEFFGDYSFTKDQDGTVHITGEPLALRELTIEAGKHLYIITPDIMTYYKRDLSTDPPQRGLDFTQMPDLEIIVSYTGNGELANGTVIRLRDNLPQITPVDMAKIEAFRTGTVLYYDDFDGITLDALDLSTFHNKEVHEALKFNDITRTFADYAQRNVLRFTSADYVTRPVIAVYPINNDNIEREKDAFVNPFSEGNIVSDEVAINEEDYGAGENTAALLNTYGGEYMAADRFALNATILQLCQQSTSAELTVRMTLDEYERLSPFVVIWYAGVLYVWTEANWANNTATIKLSKI